MENLNSAISCQSNYDLWEYLLVASPVKEVLDKIVDEKKFFYENYGQLLTVPIKSLEVHCIVEAFSESYRGWKFWALRRRKVYNSL